MQSTFIFTLRLHINYLFLSPAVVTNDPEISEFITLLIFYSHAPAAG